MNSKEYTKAVEDFTSRLFRFARKLLQNTQMAEDVVQECFLLLWENRAKVEPDKVKPWLFTTGYRQALRILAGNKRNINGLHLEMESSEKGFSDLKEVLDNCMSVLPPIQKSVLMLRDYEGYDYKEIGEILELNESQVKVYLFRARGKMKEQIKDMNFVL